MTKILTLAIALCSIPLGIAQHGFAQQVKPRFDYAQRVELAKKLYEPIRAAAIADPTSEVRYRITQNWVRIDPEWTGQFIVDNPVPTNGPLYDNKAINFIMAHPERVSDDVLLKIIEQQLDNGRSLLYGSTVVKHLTDDRRELRDKIIAAVLDPSDYQLRSPTEFLLIIRLAKLSENPQALKRVTSRIEEYYTSGRAKTMFDRLKESSNTSFSSNREFYTRQFVEYAPENMKSGFQTDGAISNDSPIKDRAIQLTRVAQVMYDDSLSNEEKASRLAEIESFDFGTMPRTGMEAASYLGSVAIFNPELALKWASQAPSPESKAWAWLVIATAIAKHDQAKANVLTKRSYSQFLKLDTSRRNSLHSNYKPTVLASSGLRLVALINPDLLDECIDKTIVTMESLDGRYGNSNTQWWHAVARIARYDPAKAEKLYAQNCDDVPLTDCVGFFRAMTALHPDEFWDEYQAMPEADKDGNDWRMRVRMRIATALAVKDDTKFWDALVPMGLLKPGRLIIPD